MLVRNLFTSVRHVAPSRHGGSGPIEQFRAYEGADFVGSLTIIAYDVIPPQSSIGLHYHASEEELYLILEGTGLMTVDEEEHIVVQGDVVLTQPGHRHGIRNDSTERLVMVAIETRVDPGSSDRNAQPGAHQ